ncbi:MAG: thioredoxin domain-containing protein [Polyangiaceae bacterium]
MERAPKKRYTWAALRIALRIASSLALGIALGSSMGCRDSSASGGLAAGAPSATPVAAADIVLPGIDTSAMTPRERREWSSLVGEVLAPCPNVPVPVSQCVKEGRPCGACVQAAKWMAQAVREGASAEQLRRAYKDRFDPQTVRSLPVDGSPSRGPDDAPVTLVEFADFECPHCREAVPLIDAVLMAHPGKVRLIYKTYTLPFHSHGELAARAAFGAEHQGKFWEMEHLLFERQQHLEEADLERYATMLKLDVPEWKADMGSPEVSERIAHDRQLGEQMKLKGTPTIYVNGRELELEENESLEARVAAELGVAPVVQPPADVAAGSDANAH